MPAKRRVFLDTSALFAGIWSAQGGARMILKLSEADVARVVVGPQVLHEVDEVMRLKAPHKLADLAILLDRCRAEMALVPPGQTVMLCQTLVSHPGDALDNEKSYVYDRDTGLLTKGDINLEASARRAAEDEIEKAALEDGILDLARQNGENYLYRLFREPGYPEVIFSEGAADTPTP
jgi:hypothetical protein